jgi:CAAX protease family protein
MNETAPGGDRRLIAPVRHTVILIAILLGIAAYGVYAQRASGPGDQLVGHRGSALPLYLGLIAAEWGLLRFVVAGGLRKTGTTWRELVGARWAGWTDVARDVAIALAAWAAWTAAESFVQSHLGSDSAKGITTLLPRGPLEGVVWVALSLTAGICEEAVFRGYLQKQFEALTGNAAVAILVQAVIFGIAHGYQGLRNMITIAALGVLYGAIAQWRRNLRAVTILHAWTDVFGGLIAGRG